MPEAAIDQAGPVRAFGQTSAAEPAPIDQAPAEPAGAGRGLAFLRVLRTFVLLLVAVVGAVLSYKSLYDRASEVFGPKLGIGFPVLVDLLIVGASLAYIVGAKIGRPRAGWRLTAHCGVAGTIALNALASPSVDQLPWHLTAPIVWSVLVELTARDVLGEYRAAHAPADRIPPILWITAPIESATLTLRVHRQRAHAAARMHVGEQSAAREVIRLALPGMRARPVRRLLGRQLRAGTLTPAQVLQRVLPLLPDANDPGVQVLRDVLTAAIAPPAEAPATAALDTDRAVQSTVQPEVQPVQPDAVHTARAAGADRAVQPVQPEVHTVLSAERAVQEVQPTVQPEVQPAVQPAAVQHMVPLGSGDFGRAVIDLTGPAPIVRPAAPVPAPAPPREAAEPVSERPLTSTMTGPGSETPAEVARAVARPERRPVSAPQPAEPTPARPALIGSKKEIARRTLLENGLDATGAIRVLQGQVSPRTVYNVLGELRAGDAAPTDQAGPESPEVQPVQPEVQPEPVQSVQPVQPVQRRESVAV